VIYIVDINEGLQKALNSHGYGFHYAVLRIIEELFNQSRSPWILEACEFPIQINNVNTRIDFILKNTQAELYIVAECKRVNPAFSDWCFVKTPYIRRNLEINDVIIDCLHFKEDFNYGNATTLKSSPEIYQLGLEVKTDLKGNQSFSSKNAIEDAATQVTRGVNGLFLEFAGRGKELVHTGNNVWFIPVIFTTAKLWTSDIDIGASELETGNVILNDINAHEKNWIWFQYHISPGIKHHLDSSQEIDENLSAVLKNDYTRTIAIVNYSGIEDYLKQQFVQ